MVLAGCLAEDDLTPERITASYPDALNRYVSVVESGETTSKIFEVQCGTPRLRIGAIYDIQGSASFTLGYERGNKSFVAVKAVNLSRARSAGEDTWYEATKPPNGTWRLDISISGGGAYAFGVYQEKPEDVVEGWVRADDLTRFYRNATSRYARDTLCDPSEYATGTQFTVPKGAQKLTVIGTYVSAARGYLTLARDDSCYPAQVPPNTNCLDPPDKGMEVRINAGDHARNVTLYQRANPNPGEWTFVASYTGGLRSVFGLYY